MRVTGRENSKNQYLIFKDWERVLLQVTGGENSKFKDSGFKIWLILLLYLLGSFAFCLGSF
jgi:hypothetical protein